MWICASPFGGCVRKKMSVDKKKIKDAFVCNMYNAILLARQRFSTIKSEFSIEALHLYDIQK